MGAMKPVGQLYGSPTALRASIWPWIATVNMLFKLREWRDEYFWNTDRNPGKTHRNIRTTRGRPASDVNTMFAAEFTFCCA